MNETAVNLFMAHRCYPFSYSVDPLDRVIIQTDRITRWEFDLFATTPQGAADREAALIWLGEDANIELAYFKGQDDLLENGWAWVTDNGDSGAFKTGFDTFQEALIAAIEFLMKKEKQIEWQSVDRTHEECCGCAYEESSPPKCKGHSAGETHCHSYVMKEEGNATG